MEHIGPAYLTELVFSKPATVTTTVRLSFPRPDQLDVVFVGAEQTPSLSLSSKAGQFKCDGSTLVVTTHTANWAHGAAGFPAAGGESIVMKIDLVEGCLIVTRRAKDYMWLPFPGWSTWSSWYRFCAAPSDAGPVSER